MWTSNHSQRWPTVPQSNCLFEETQGREGTTSLGFRQTDKPDTWPAGDCTGVLIFKAHDPLCKSLLTM